METYLKVFMALAPPLIWLLYFRERERFATPAAAVWLAFLCGVLVTYPTFLIQQFLSNSPHLSFRWFHELAAIRALDIDGALAIRVQRGVIQGGVAEEIIKLLASLVLYGLFRRTLRPWHLPVIIVALGCGFAIVESSFIYFSKPDWQQAVWLRSFSSGHVFYGAIMGAFLALGLMGRAAIAMFTAALLLPMLFHAGYNLTIALSLADGPKGVIARVVFVAMVLLLGLLAVILTRQVARLGDRDAANDRLEHPWLRHPRIREWSWLFLAMFCGLVSLVFPFMFGKPAAFARMGEPVVLGICAVFSAILFILRARAAAKDIRTARTAVVNDVQATSGRLA